MHINKKNIKPLVAAIAATAVLAGIGGVATAAPLWSAKVKASNGTDSNEVVLGAAQDASDGFESGYEVRAIVSSRLAAYFLHPEWGLETGYFWADIKDTALPKEWRFYVSSSASEQVDLTWDQNVPDNIQLSMVDEATSSVMDMKTAGSYRFTSTAASPRSFKVTAASAAPADTTAPDTKITSVPSGYIKTPSATVSFTGTDNLSTALKYSYKTDSNEWSSWSASGTAQLSLADGSHVFYARAMDEAGNIDLTPAQASFTVDTVAPGLSLKTSAKTTIKSNNTTKYILITGAVSDATSGLSSVVYNLTDEYGLYTSSDDLGTSSTISFRPPIKAYCRPNDTDGRVITVTVTAKDKANNVTSRSIKFTIVN